MNSTAADPQSDVPGPAAPGAVRPKAHPDVTLHKVTETDGVVHYVLRQPHHLNCLRLTEAQVVIWEMLDGEHSLEDVETAYLKVHRRLPDGLDELLGRLAEGGFLVDPGPLLPRGMPAARSHLGRIEIAPGWLAKVLSVCASPCAWCFARGSAVTLVLTTLGVLAGLVGFVWFAHAAQHLEPGWLQWGGSCIWGFIALVVWNVVISWVESVASIAMLSANGQPTARSGLVLRWGVPYVFVNTSEGALLARHWRFLLAAVPLAADGVALLALTALYTVTPWLGYVWLIGATVVLIRAAVQLCPLCPTALSRVVAEATGQDDFRQRALRFLRRRVVEKFTSSAAWSRWELGYLVYGMVAGVWLVYAAQGLVWLLSYNLPALLAELFHEGHLISRVIALLIMLALLAPLALFALLCVWWGVPKLVRYAWTHPVWRDDFNVCIILVLVAVALAFLPLALPASWQGIYVRSHQVAAAVCVVVLGAVVLWQTGSLVARASRRPILLAGVAVLASAARCLVEGNVASGVSAGLSVLLGVAATLVAIRLLNRHAHTQLGISWLLIVLGVAALLVTQSVSAAVRHQTMALPLASAVVLGAVILVNALLPAMLACFRTGVSAGWLLSGMVVALAVPVIVLGQLVAQSGLPSVFAGRQVLDGAVVLGSTLFVAGGVLHLLAVWRGPVQLRPFPIRTEATERQRLADALNYLVQGLLDNVGAFYGHDMHASLATSLTREAHAQAMQVDRTGKTVHLAPEDETQDLDALAVRARTVLQAALDQAAASCGRRFVRRVLASTYQRLHADERRMVAGSLLPEGPWSDVTSQPEVPAQDIAPAIRQLLFFQSLSDDEMGTLCTLFHTRTYGPRQTIVHQGQPAHAFYVLQQGEARALEVDESGAERPVADLGPGDHFGDEALGQGGAHATTVRTRSEVTLLQLAGEHFDSFAHLGDQLLEKVEATREDVALLKSVSLFHELPPTQVALLLSKFREVTAPAGTEIIREGDSGDTFYVIKSGTVEVVKGCDGESLPLATLSRGQYFGEIALIRDVPRTATVRATSPVELWSLTKGDFLRLVGRDMGIREELRETIDQRLQEQDPSPPSPDVEAPLAQEPSGLADLRAPEGAASDTSATGQPGPAPPPESPGSTAGPDVESDPPAPPPDPHSP